jgi:hypothetical protein
MFKPLAALIAAATLAMPATAKVDPGTTRLLQTLTEYGVTVEFNPSHCSNGYNGRYTTAKVMTLCYRGAPSAEDFDTVRHETFHFLQHCAAIKRGQNGIYPLAVNNSARTEWAYSILGANSISQIKSIYPTHHHQVEIEAFAAARHYSADELATLVRSWC